MHLYCTRDIKCKNYSVTVTWFGWQVWFGGATITRKNAVEVSCSLTYCTPVHLVESVETVNCVWDGIFYAAATRALCIAHLLLRARFVMTPAPSIKSCAIASCRLFHSHTQVASFTDSMMWIGVYHALLWSISGSMNCIRKGIVVGNKQ